MPKGIIAAGIVLSAVSFTPTYAANGGILLAAKVEAGAIIDGSPDSVWDKAKPLMERLADRLHLRVHWHIFIDGAGQDEDIPLLTAGRGHTIDVRRGRPDWDELFALIAIDHPRLTCFTCGPPPMLADVARSGRRIGWNVHQEHFN